MNGSNNIFHSLVIAVLLLSGNTAYANTAGHVQFVNGAVQLTNSAGQTHSVQKGDAVNEGDTLTSAPAASAQIKMQDGGFVAMRPDTQLKFDSFKFSGQEDGSEQSFFSLFKGGFRAVTGLIGRVNKTNYRITTPTSTIGIRGTDHETFVVVPGSELAAVAPTGAYNKVNIGETYMATERGTIFVLPNQMGFAGAKDQMPKLQPLNTNLFTVAPAPTPQAKSDKKESKEEVRESTAVDNTAKEKAAAPAPTTAALGNTVPTNFILLNVTTTGGIPLTGGGATVSAAYVQTDKAVAYATLDAGGNTVYANGTFIAAPADMNNTLPNPSVTDRYAGNSPGSYITHTDSGTTTIGEATTTIVATGIQFGRYDSTSSQMVVVGTTYTGLAPGTYSSGGAVKSHWIVGPAIDPLFLPEVLTGTATYTLAGGTTPTAVTGAISTLNTASLSVNFTQQLVSLNLGLTVGGAAWTASTSNAPLQTMYWNNAQAGFGAQTLYPGPIHPGWGTLAVSCPSCSVTAHGTVVGQLTGPGLTGAILSYLLGNGVNEAVAGVAAFTGTAQNIATPYRIAALSTVDPAPPASAFPVGVAPFPIGVVFGGYNNAGNLTATVQTDPSGNLTQLKAGQPFTNGSGITVGIGTATPAGLGTDPISGISWGRWVGGALSKTDLATNVVTSHQNTAAGTGAALSTHWIASSALVGPVTLPISGTYNYVLAGGTAPTDSLGGVGTLNSATLSANFTAQTVAVGINVTTPNAGNLVASGTAIPIEQKSFFGAGTANTAGYGQSTNPGLLTVTCPAGCGTVGVAGHVAGVFTGAGGIGAAVVYNLGKGGVLVNGVTAFHR